MILSRVKTDSANSKNSIIKKSSNNKIPEFEDYLVKRDYIGARAYLQFKELEKHKKFLIDEWIAFCTFHLGDYETALKQYEELQLNLAEKDDNIDDQDQDHDKDNININDDEAANQMNAISLNIAVCQFYLGNYSAAQTIIEQLSNGPLKIRLLFHLSHKLNDTERMMELHSSLRDITEDQLSLAGMHYLRANYQDAIDIYKRILLDKKDLLAVNVYVALCYYKLDYYDISQEVLELYLSKFGDSIIALNLKACNRFRLFNGQTAEMEIKSLIDTETFGVALIKHNLVVFRNGDGALQIFPTLIDIIPEARFNLAIYYLRTRELDKVEELMRDIQPTVPYEYILKGVVHAALGQHSGSKEHLKNAQQYLHLVGGSASECDTIPGRQSMASAYFLYGQFEEVLVYLNSIRSYFINDDIFNYNYAQAKVATGCYKEAEEILLQINDLLIRNQHTFSMVLAKSHIYSGHAEQAWNIYTNKDTNDESFILLQMIANECYKIGEFWVAAKSFDMLEKLEPNPEYWEGKRGALAGSLYAHVSQQNIGMPPDGITSICTILRDSSNSSSGQAELMLRTIRRYANELK